jgi:hypothetical protein
MAEAAKIGHRLFGISRNRFPDIAIAISTGNVTAKAMPAVRRIDNFDIPDVSTIASNEPIASASARKKVATATATSKRLSRAAVVLAKPTTTTIIMHTIASDLRDWIRTIAGQIR